MNLKDVVAAVGSMFPDSPWIVCGALFLVVLAWRSPLLLKYALEHYRLNKRSNADIAALNKKTALELESKRLTLENKKKGSTR